MMAKGILSASAYESLREKAAKIPSLSELINTNRISLYKSDAAGLCFSYGCSSVSDEVFSDFQSVSDELNLVSQYKQLLDGAIMNVTEDRAVLHHRERDPKHYQSSSTFSEMRDFVESIHAKKKVGLNGQSFTDFIQIGIGGSELGPKAICHALAEAVSHDGPGPGEHGLAGHFLCHLDSRQAESLFQSVDLSRTLVIVVSKSGTTEEPLKNLDYLISHLGEKGINAEDYLSQHLVAVSCTGTALWEKGAAEFLATFSLDEAVGGRFSTSSVVGMLALGLQNGMAAVHGFLDGARAMDENALIENCQKNLSLLAALLSVWERHFLGLSQRVLLAYSEGLQYIPEHVQQLHCESNGKGVDRHGVALTHAAAAMMSTGLGTAAQHAFFQLLHQGVETQSVSFIAVQDSSPALRRHVAAQQLALALGQDSENGHERFPGNRGSSLILLPQLDAKSLGAVVAFYENLAMFEGFIWDINSFDQPGVELGKRLVGDLEQGSGSEVLQSMAALLGLV